MHMIDMFDSIDMQTAYILGYIMVDRLQKGFDGSLSVRYSTIKSASLILGYFRAQVTPMSLTPGTIPWARIRCSTPPSTWTRTPVVTLALLTVAQLSSPGLSVMEWVDGMCWNIRQSRKCGRRWHSFFLVNLLWFCVTSGWLCYTASTRFHTKSSLLWWGISVWGSCRLAILLLIRIRNIGSH